MSVPSVTCWLMASCHGLPKLSPLSVNVQVTNGMVPRAWASSNRLRHTARHGVLRKMLPALVGVTTLPLMLVSCIT